MKYINQFCRYVVGVLFILSGLIKLNDPIGTAIKLEEYFEVFSHDFHPFFQTLANHSLFFSVVMIVLEVVLGVAILLYYKASTTTSILLLLIVFFTFLTFYSAFFNKVTDCGCFGDALKLTPWTSFGKDIVLLILILVLFFQRKELKPVLSGITGHTVMALSLLFSLYIAYFTINHLSFIDFRAYKVGANIPALMKPSAPIQYSYTLTKDGKEYTFEQYPTDTSYKYKSMEIVNKNALPKITDYSIWNDEGDFTQQSLTGTRLMIFILKATEASTKNLEKIKKLAKETEKLNVLPMLITASDAETFATFRNEHQIAIPYYFADATVIKTIIRSNPGLLVIKDGVVKAKWHYNDVPTLEELKSKL